MSTASVPTQEGGGSNATNATAVGGVGASESGGDADSASGSTVWVVPLVVALVFCVCVSAAAFTLRRRRYGYRHQSMSQGGSGVGRDTGSISMYSNPMLEMPASSRQGKATLNPTIENSGFLVPTERMLEQDGFLVPHEDEDSGYLAVGTKAMDRDTGDTGAHHFQAVDAALHEGSRA